MRCFIAASLFLASCHALKMQGEATPCKQVLKASQEGMAYLSPLDVGGQTVNAILDTGSFEVVVESTDCEKCPEASYNPRLSKTYMHEPTHQKQPPADKDLLADADLLAKAKTEQGKMARDQLQAAARLSKENLTTIAYGSGPVGVVPGSDSVSVPGCAHLQAKKIGIQEILDHRIPLLQMPGAMTAIVGMGPGLANESEQRLHHVLGSPRFSFCLADDRLADGVIWWHDTDRSADEHFEELDVTGKMFWAFDMKDLAMGNKTVGCQSGCGAILDTGTSLLTFDRETTENIASMWSEMQDCTSYKELPSLTFTFGGKEVTLPPEAYVVITTDDGSEPLLEEEQQNQTNIGKRLPLSHDMAKEFFKKNPVALYEFLKNPDVGDIIQQIMGGADGEGGEPNMGDVIQQIMGGEGGDALGGLDIKDLLDRLSGGQLGAAGPAPACQLMLTPPMDLGMTPNGPMVIIGMPFFRSYYSTFDDSDPQNRRVFVSKSLTCEGELVNRQLLSTETSMTSKLRHVSNLQDHTEAATQHAKRLASRVRASGL